MDKSALRGQGVHFSHIANAIRCISRYAPDSVSIPPMHHASTFRCPFSCIAACARTGMCNDEETCTPGIGGALPGALRHPGMIEIKTPLAFAAARVQHCGKVQDDPHALHGTIRKLHLRDKCGPHRSDRLGANS